jgi:hypothetical protein
MDEFILKLYESNIIILKDTKFKNGTNKKLYINFFKIFEHKFLVLKLVKLVYDKIYNINDQIDFIYGYKELCSYLSLLLFYQYNYKIILHKNIHNLDDDGKNILIIKNTSDNTTNFNKTVEILNKKQNVNNFYIFSLLNNSNITNSKFLYLFDEHEIIFTLYVNKIINYEKYLNIHLNLSSYLNIFDNNNFKSNNSLIEVINKKKSIIGFSDKIIKTMEIKEIIKLIDFVGPHISIFLLTNKCSLIEYNSIQKLAKHHNFLLINTNNEYNHNRIKVVNSENIITNENINLNENNKYFVINNISNKFNNIFTCINYFVNISQQVLGIITSDHIPLSRKINIYIDKKNSIKIEDILLKNNFDMIISENPNTIINLKQITWNIHKKKYEFIQK